jgi:protein-disulfide isomerase
MRQQVEQPARDATLVEDAARIRVMGFQVLEALPSRGAPYDRVDPFILVHEARIRLSDATKVDTKHPHRGFDNLWYVLESSASTGPSIWFTLYSPMRIGGDAMRPVAEDLTPPVDPDRDHWRGGDRAVVTLVEYGDYECPYSRAAFRAIQRLEQQLGGRLRFVFRHFPLTGIHPHALAAAHLAEAAALQDRFWPMHELLFHRQEALEDPDLLGYADRLGLDRGRLGVDLDGGTVWQRVQVDADSALASGARGTPTLFINGRLHAGGYDQPNLGAALATVVKGS